jgi:hypothetical protein
MLLTTENLRVMAGKLDAARKDSAQHCKVPLRGPDGKTFRLEPKRAESRARLVKMFGEERVIEDDGKLFLSVDLGVCGHSNLGIDPETFEIACVVHGRER